MSVFGVKVKHGTPVEIPACKDKFIINIWGLKMGFAGVVCYSNVAYMGDLWGPNIIFYHEIQNPLQHPW